VGKKKIGTVGALRAALAKQYSPPEYVYVEEATLGSRRVDGIAMNLWSSRGFTLHGFEIKVSRSDWQSEKKRPAKAEAVTGYFDYWWLVAPNEEVIPRDEVPDGWGLLVIEGTCLKVVVRARDRNGSNRRERNDMPRNFVARLLAKTAAQLARWEELRPLVDDAEAEAHRRFEEGEKLGRKLEMEKTNDLRAQAKKVQEFQDATGLNICDRYGYSFAFKDTVRLTKLLRGLTATSPGGIEGALKNLVRIQENLFEAITALREANDKIKPLCS